MVKIATSSMKHSVGVSIVIYQVRSLISTWLIQSRDEWVSCIYMFPWLVRAQSWGWRSPRPTCPGMVPRCPDWTTSSGPPWPPAGYGSPHKPASASRTRPVYALTHVQTRGPDINNGTVSIGYFYLSVEVLLPFALSGHEFCFWDFTSLSSVCQFMQNAIYK